MDHADHRAARTAAGVGGTLSVSIASQLCGCDRRDRGAAAGAGTAVASGSLHDPQRRGSGDTYPGRKPRTRGVARDHRAPGHGARDVMIDHIPEPGEASVRAWLGFILM